MNEISYFKNFQQVLRRDPDNIAKNIKNEEAARKVPLRINSAYGKRKALEQHSRQHVRIIQTREFYSKNGTGL